MSIAVFRRKGRTEAERFADLYIPEPNSGCWLWMGALSTEGYALFCENKTRRSELAHRYAWRVANCKEIPPKMAICHSCDMRCCVNPDHLFLGTYADNMQDMLTKGRDRYVRGSAHLWAKLDEEKVRLIRSDSRSDAELGKLFNVAPGTIYSVRIRQSWKRV